MGVKKKQKNLHRKITHTRYTGIKKIGDKGPQSWLQKEIIEIYGKRIGFKYVTDEYIEAPANAYITPIVGGGVALLYIVITSYLYFKRGVFAEGSFNNLLYFFAWFVLFLFIVYYFTMPKKEIILNRLEGTITFPGFMWKKNITMPFDAIKFSYTTGGSNGIGAYQLMLIRPDKAGSTLQFPFGGVNCYIDLSLITWYMDKNRPLPPHTDLDPYREKDFQRRKKGKFKKPLYRSQIPTPEATPEQQAEREKFWKG